MTKVLKIVRIVTGMAGGALIAGGSYAFICDDTAANAYTLCSVGSCLCLAVSLGLTAILTSLADQSSSDTFRRS
jgi:hypothetical protein